LKTGNFSTLKDVLDDMIQELQLDGKMNELKVRKIWYEQMQGIIAKNTKQILLRNKKLYVYIESAVIKQELFMAREKICQIINDKMGNKIVDEVIIN
jgi:predicted nucleic acid-binding Zn ribbon protein